MQTSITRAQVNHPLSFLLPLYPLSVADGSGSYTITEADGIDVGTKIVIELNDESKDFATEAKIRATVDKYRCVL